jgi:histidyl-tRNA synthetase
MPRRSEQGKQISRLVTVMVTELNAYTGSKRTRKRYTAFRKAKRELYALRPDLAPGVMRFVVSQTHWGTPKANG